MSHLNLYVVGPLRVVVVRVVMSRPLQPPSDKERVLFVDILSDCRNQCCLHPCCWTGRKDSICFTRRSSSAPLVGVCQGDRVVAVLSRHALRIQQAVGTSHSWGCVNIYSCASNHAVSAHVISSIRRGVLCCHLWSY